MFYSECESSDNTSERRSERLDLNLDVVILIDKDRGKVN